jgi:hypothetical protein
MHEFPGGLCVKTHFATAYGQRFKQSTSAIPMISGIQALRMENLQLQTIGP